jgi:transcriptional regulator with XRE-family HTH domain
MSFAEKLRELRTAKEMSRKELAKASGLGNGTVRDYEQGKRKPSFESAVRLATALGLTCEAFADSLDAKSKPAPKKRKGK